MAECTISRLAKAANVSVETVRYYQRVGLLDKPSQLTMNGYHYYSEDDVTRLRFIKYTQTLKFTLNEIRQLLELSSHKNNCAAVQRLSEQKLTAITAQINELQNTRKRLQTLLEKCDSNVPNCSMLNEIWNHSHADSIDTEASPCCSKKTETIA